ncbi:hypothetical protein HMF3257_20715 [Spirosoma telluris]|uniref:Uncharacterized protein n=1 Tax=Spirosoma telluris TaxID=2183553 RepID=A0A327NPQ4_9BACT|nr:hypothetical protein HMF3257_20715 [Spirosoma telluris]
MVSQKWPKRQWADIKKRLATNFPANFHTDKTIEMLDHCVLADELKILTPYISLGRLCLSRNTNLADYDCPCMYFHNDQYTVSTYDNLNKWYFNSSKEAVEFVKQNIPLIV